MASTTGRWYLGRLVGNRAARITVGLVALAFAGGFWLLTESGAIEPGPTVAIIGVVLFVVIALPLGWLVGRSADRKINSNR